MKRNSGNKQEAIKQIVALIKANSIKINEIAEQLGTKNKNKQRKNKANNCFLIYKSLG